MPWLRLSDEPRDIATNAIHDKGESPSGHVVAATLEASQILCEWLEDLLAIAVLILNFTE